MQKITLILVIIFLAISGKVMAEKAEYSVVFCYNADENHLVRSFLFEGCRPGYKQTSRKKWLKLAFKNGRITQAQFEFFEKTKPESLDANLTTHSNGSSFAINSEGLMVTSYHVLEPCKEVLIVSEVDLFKVEEIAISKENDLAVIKSNYKPNGIATIREPPMVLGEKLYAFGFPLLATLRTFNMTPGIVSGSQGMGTRAFVQLAMSLQPGNSGGPIVDESGLVSGVVAARLRQGPGVAFGLQNKVLRKFLNKNKISFSTDVQTNPMDTKKMAVMANNFTRPLVCLVEK